MTPVPCAFRPDLLTDGKPRCLAAGERLGDLVADERGLLVYAHEGQLVDLVIALNASDPDRPPVHATIIRVLDHPGGRVLRFIGIERCH